MEQVSEIREIKPRLSYQHIRKIMDISALCEHIIGKEIVEAEAYTNPSVLIITLSDDTYIEITVDAIYSEVPALDD